MTALPPGYLSSGGGDSLLSGFGSNNNSNLSAPDTSRMSISSHVSHTSNASGELLCAYLYVWVLGVLLCGITRDHQNDVSMK